MYYIDCSTLFILSTIIASISAYLGTNMVTTSFGVVRGETISSTVRDLPPVTQYLGIPYGVAPSGLYRFNMAISAAKWTHLPKNANKLSAVCIQSGLPELSENEALKSFPSQRYDYIHRLLPRLKPQSEDCLYMNLYVPERIEPARASLPVLVLVHGDEYGWNSGNPYNGSILASFGQIVVVTLNYRLGVYGFLGRCESNSCSGNAGLSDLVAALKMLSNTLPAFGGDPSTITLLGWGSGAAIVSLLMASPITQPNHRLFRRAVLLDGSALAPWGMIRNPQPNFFQLAEHLKCVDLNKTSRKSPKRINIDDVLRCMQDQSSDNITLASRKVLRPTFLSTFAPIVDGQMVPNRPEVLFSPKFGALFRDIDLMIGVSDYPAYHLLPENDLRQGISKERRLKIFRTLVRNMYDLHRTEILAAIINEYTDWNNPKDHPKNLAEGVLNALSDFFYVTPTVQTARYHSTDESKRVSNTFMFVFSHQSKNFREQLSYGMRGSLSGDHIPYILGYPLYEKMSENQLFTGFTQEDQTISRVLMQYISNFVKSGDPSKPIAMMGSDPIIERFYGTSWPQFNPSTRDAYLEISERPQIKNYYRNARVGFWSTFVPQLHSTGNGEVPEEHNFLPNHFRKDLFYGVVRPYASYANDPFPPPPPPPSPIPKLTKKVSEPSPSSSSSTINLSTPKTPAVVVAQNSTMLSVTVAIGCGLLFLNICIGLGLYKQCSKREQSKKKMQMQFQTYSANRTPGPDINYNLNATNQEPLLPLNKNLMAPLRTGISPNCPRHGRAAMNFSNMKLNSTAIDTNLATVRPTLEEIQV